MFTRFSRWIQEPCLQKAASVSLCSSGQICLEEVLLDQVEYVASCPFQVG